MALSREQKIAFGVFIVIGIAALILGILQFKRNLNAPFVRRGGVYKSAEERAAEAVAALKIKDTDNDGLSDFDELNLYRTSPYLADSDSDGVPDGLEVKSGDDPNCPKGRECGGSSSLPEGADSGAAMAPFAPPEMPALSIPAMSPTELRALLRQAGLAEETLSQVDDATLSQLYAETAKQMMATTTK